MYNFLGLLDYDVVELTNLHRQILHKESSVNTTKCKSAKDTCQALNSSVSYKTHSVSLSRENALDIINQYDLILDCTDNVATRYLLNDACVLAKKVRYSIYIFSNPSISVLRWSLGVVFHNEDLL